MLNPSGDVSITDSIVKEFENNSLLWGMYYLKEHFRVGSAPFHLKIVKEAKYNRFLAVAAPRGFAKSTILTLLTPSHAIFFKRKHFIVIAQSTYDKATQSLENIKKEYRENPKIKELGVRITKDSEGDSIFRHKDGFETRVLCKGAEQLGGVRGEKFGAWRPDLILVDDLEDDELVRNPIRRKNLRATFDEALIPAGDKETMDVIVIGTILHDDALMALLVSKGEYPEYRKLLYKALGDSGKSLWPEKMSVAELEDLRAKKPAVFAKEYQNDPSHGDMNDIKASDFRRWKIIENDYVLYDENDSIICRGELRTCRAAISCDLAWEEKRESDSTAIVPGFLTPESYLLVDDYFHKKGVKPDVFMATVVEMEKRLRALTGYYVPVGLEKAKLEKVYKHLFREWMKKNNHWISFKDLIWDADKIQRIMVRCQPRYAQHSLFHKAGMGELELQMTRIRSTPHDDLADAVQGLCQLLDFPKGRVIKREESKDDKFMQLRKWAITQDKRKTFVFGGKGKRVFPFNSVTCPI